jgi:hypothetical protein
MTTSKRIALAGYGYRRSYLAVLEAAHRSLAAAVRQSVEASVDI